MSKEITSYDKYGRPHGYFEIYYDDGQLWYKGSYIHGEKHGYWEFYEYSGKLRFKGNYFKGVEYGHWEFYHDNGKVEYRGYFIKNIFIGLRLYYKIIGVLSGGYYNYSVDSSDITLYITPKNKILI